MAGVSLNRVFLAGNLTRDPEGRRLATGTAVCKLGLAVNRRFKDSNSGELRDETTFVDVETWGRQAETCNEYLRKGAPVLVEGRLRTDQWEDRESGQRRSRLLVVAERVHFLSGPAGRGPAADGGAGGELSRPAPAARSPRPAPPFPAAGAAPAANAAPAATAAPAGEKPPPAAPGAAFDVNDEAVDDIPF